MKHSKTGQAFTACPVCALEWLLPPDIIPCYTPFTFEIETWIFPGTARQGMCELEVKPADEVLSVPPNEAQI